MFGHIDEQYTLPIGVMAEIDADAGNLTSVLSESYHPLKVVSHTVQAQLRSLRQVSYCNTYT